MPWPLPANLRTEAKRRARVLLGDARGPVLDLGGKVSPIASGDWGSSRAIETVSLGPGPDPTAALEDLAGPAAGFAEILGVLVTPRVADLPRLFEAVAALLSDDSRFLFVEPDAVAQRWSGYLSPGLRSLSGLELGRDITGAMWDSGLSVADIDRRPVARTPWPLRNLVSGVARLAPRPGMTPRRS